MKSLQGHFLVASPRLVDSNFFKSVILLIQHTTDGALGVVVNRPMEATIADAWQQVSQSPCKLDAPLHQGGPCEGPLMVLHGDGLSSEAEIAPGVHFSTERAAIERLIASDEARAKFIVGYAGWAPGQLEGEIEEGSWLSIPATGEALFTPDDGQWTRLMRLIARTTSFAWIDPKIMPDDPSMN